MLGENWIQIPHEMQTFSAMYPYFHSGITFRQLIFHKKNRNTAFFPFSVKNKILQLAPITFIFLNRALKYFMIIFISLSYI